MPGILVGVDGSHHSRRALEWAMREAATHQVPLTVLAVYPAPVRPAAELITASCDADLLVVGSRGGGGPVREFVMGSVSSKVAHHAACPVVVIRRNR